ncbi:MAG: YfcE family phosphodiesterase [Candidatus Lokiarchaeota archaeon]|nr:YfcE family phosphodiesterase [Candidatus Lokiarchaeota archaeon]MBD3341801.1 YfcE family phosphodiesterase [Candidatus Lokiarchaeota archaeon]
MVKLGIISDTHIYSDDNAEEVKRLLKEIKKAFKDVDQIIHAGDVCEAFLVDRLNDIAPTTCVKGNMDKIVNLDKFIILSAGSYRIGVIHEPPQDLKGFFKTQNIHILIHGHTHAPLIKGTPYNTLIVNPGSPTRPVAPPKKPYFQDPIARPSVITLSVNENDLLSTYLINLQL